MSSHAQVATKVRQQKEKHPENYCEKCLYRIRDRKGNLYEGCTVYPNRCPKHIFQECGVKSLDQGTYGYPCIRRRGHVEKEHECLDKDDCPHHYIKGY